MNSLAHRTIKAARDELVDRFQLFAMWDKNTSAQDMAEGTPGDLTTEQFTQLCEITQRLWDLMIDDPYPPDCIVCGDTLPLPAGQQKFGWSQTTGRPRRYCSNKCRQADYRERQAQGGSEDLDQLAHGLVNSARAEVKRIK